MVRRELTVDWHEVRDIPFADGTTDSDAFNVAFKYDEDGLCSGDTRIDKFFNDILLSHTNDAANGVRALKFGYDSSGAGATCNIDLNQSFDGLLLTQPWPNSV